MLVRAAVKTTTYRKLQISSRTETKKLSCNYTPAHCLYLLNKIKLKSTKELTEILNKPYFPGHAFGNAEIKMAFDKKFSLAEASYYVKYY